jgi:hypothetical protein
LWGARAEGYEEAVNQAKFTNVQTNSKSAEGSVVPDPEPEFETCTDCGVELTDEDFAFEQYSDGFDDGYTEAIADVKESLEF